VYSSRFGRSRIAHQERMFSKKGQNGWPSCSSQSLKYWMIDSGGGAIGGPTRPGVSLSSSYQSALAFLWWLYMLHTTSRPSRPI
jgi:hypothetical protein